MQGRNSSSSRPLMTPESHDSEFEDNSNATPDSTQPQERVITDTPHDFIRAHSMLWILIRQRLRRTIGW